MRTVFGVVEGCSSTSSRAARAERWPPGRGGAFSDPFFGTGLYRTILDAADDDLCRELLSHLAANGTWLTPTLAVLTTMASLERLRGEDDPRMQYMSPAIVQGWMTPFPGMASDTPDAIETRGEFLDRQLAVTGMAAAAGVGISPGNDSRIPFVLPRLQLTRVELLVRRG